MTIRYDDVLGIALNVLEDARYVDIDVLLLRDVTGRVHLLLSDNITSSEAARLDGLMREALGPYAPPTGVVLLADNGLTVESLLGNTSATGAAQDLIQLRPKVRLLERFVTGADWRQVGAPHHPNWTALYSFKGGVGRSTAGAWLARSEAARGRCVLVVDLDLESPGISQLLQSSLDAPEHGVVDHLAEAAVSNAQDLNLTSLAHAERDNFGEVWVLPAQGRPRAGYDYLGKLNRSYSPASVDGKVVSFARRLEAAIEAGVAQVSAASRMPDLVLLDSRAGLHDIAAVTLTQLASSALIFAGSTRATWQGYNYLAQQWASNPPLAREMRGRMKMIASLTPDVRTSEYLSTFAEEAHLCWSQLYDDVEAHAEGFNFAPEDINAPHYPLPIFFDQSLRHLDQASFDDALRSRLAQAAYSDFLQGVRPFLGDGER